MASFEIHTVDNQPPPFAPRNLWTDEPALQEAVQREGAAAFVPNLSRYAVVAGDELYRIGALFMRNRLGGEGGSTFGTLTGETGFGSLIDRA